MSDQWHYAINQVTHGPVSGADLRALIEDGTVTRASLVWTEGMNDWKPAGELREFFAPAPPPVPAAPPPLAPAAPPTVPGAIPVQTGDATGGVIPYKNPCALIGYYLAIGSLLFGPVLGAVALGLGIAGLRARKKQPQIKGAAHAWIAIIGGSFTTFGYGAIFLVLILMA